MKNEFMKLGYELLPNKSLIIYRKLLGDSEITIEYNKSDNRFHKYINDFRKKVEIDFDQSELQILQNKEIALYNLTNME